MKGKRGTICIGVGLLLLAAALSLTLYNLWSDKTAGERSQAVLEQIESAAGGCASTNSAYSLLGSDADMPYQIIDGHACIGELSISALSLELPVISEWSYANLNVAPCRYAGTVYKRNMVIAAHDYFSHFGTLQNLSLGDEVTFTDIDGNAFHYEVAELETIDPFDVQGMTSGEWDLTLFTCTISGQARIAVRCDLV